MQCFSQESHGSGIYWDGLWPMGERQACGGPKYKIYQNFNFENIGKEIKPKRILLDSFHRNGHIMGLHVHSQY